MNPFNYGRLLDPNEFFYSSKVENEDDAEEAFLL